MTREETLRLLEFLRGSYPAAKIEDAAATANAWSLVFQEEPAANVYRAARLHITRSPFFPTPADIKNCITRAAIIYDTPTIQALQESSKPALEDPQQEPEPELDIEDLWEWLFSDD